MGGYQELKVWQTGIEITKAAYKLTSKFPKEERYGLISQIRRCAVSIPSNIAEGHSRESKRELARFASIARGSLAELETQLIIAKLDFFRFLSTSDPQIGIGKKGLLGSSF